MHLYRSYWLGIVMSLFGAAIGAGLWFGISVLRGEVYHWLGISVGVLAGFGMLLGYDEADDWGGLTAVVIAVLGIIATEVALFFQIVLPLVQEKRDELIFTGMILGNETDWGLFVRLMTGPAEFFFLIAAIFVAYLFGRKGIPLGD